jgi:hypothetical protein
MKVENNLAATTIHINKEPVALPINSEFLGNLSRNLPHMSEDVVIRLNIVQGWNMSPGNNKYVNRCYWPCVVERYHALILVYHVCRHLAADYAAKDAFG